MLPSRSIVRRGSSSVSPRRLLQSQCANPPRAISQRLGQGRRFSSLRSSHLVGLASTSPFRARNATGPVLLGGVTSSRQLSIWGYGKKATPSPPPEEDASSASAPAPASASEAAPAPEAVLPVDTAPDTANLPTSEVDFASISDIVNGQEILNMPEQIGYLSALGLDFGWGPTSLMQWALEHVHIYTGLGWGTSIMATALLLRCIMFYPQIQSLKFNAVMQNLRKDPRSQEAMKLLQQGFQNGDMEMRQKGQYINKMLKQQYGVSNMGMLWSFGQIPFAFGLFRIVSGMANVPVPALENAGFLWFSDLTAADPYFILPAVGTAFMVGSLAINAKNTPEKQRKMLKTMTYVFGVVGFVATTFLSAAVNLMAVALGAATLITAALLNNAVVRRNVGLPPIITPIDSLPPRVTIYEPPRATEIAGLRERLNNNLTDVKKGLTDQLSNYTGSYAGSEQDKAEKKRRDLIRRLEETRKQQEQEEFEKKYKSKS